jgi:hypothetical protein
MGTMSLRLLRLSAYGSLVVAGVLAGTVATACGGNSKPAESPAGDTSASTSAEPSSSSATTTTDVPGEGQGTKLAASTAEPAASTPTASASASTGDGSEPAKDAGRTTNDIKALVTTHRSEARACYDSALKQHPGIEGDITVKWLIDPRGNVTEARIDEGRSTIKDDNLSACLIGLFKRLKFPASAKGFETRAAYPFNFHPRAAARE